jgi:hypothetical protein
MTRNEIDLLWHQAMREAIDEGEMFTRYHFAKKIAEIEREECAKLCEQPVDEIQITDSDSELIYMDGKECSAAIRGRTNANTI